MTQQRLAARRSNAGDVVQFAGDLAALLAVIGDREPVGLVPDGGDEQHLRSVLPQRDRGLLPRQEDPLAALKALVAVALSPALREAAEPDVVLEPQLLDRALGCRDLTCLFVSYAGQPPSSYLDAVLDLPSDEFCALSLVNLPQPGAVEGKYCFSQQYSQLAPDEERDITRALEGRTTYLDAMRAAAVVPFLRQLARAEKRNQRCLIVEDGGYLAPALMDAMARGLTVGQFARGLGHDVADERPVAAVAKQRTIATVEHTRNGFDRLERVRIEHGHLPLPTYSIAISRLKRSVESCEVAASVLSAIESVLNAAGRVLSRRRCLVLGSRGAIGGELCRHLRTRLDRPAQALTGVDLKVDRSTDALGITEAHRLEDLSEARWLDTDLVIGVTGESVLRGGDIETWLRDSDHDTLTLVSGSTKKVEFAAIMRWFDDLVHQDAPRIDGARVSPHVHEMLDPRTARAYGHRWVF